VPDTYAIGDIHGSLKELETLIRHLQRVEGFSNEDTLVFVGDYIDRGPDSKGVIECLLNLSEYQKCVFLMGNHEDMMLWYLGIDHGRQRISLTDMEIFDAAWFPNGGGDTMRSYGLELGDYMGAPSQRLRLDLMEAIPATHIGFLKRLQYFHIEGSHLFVHAGVGRRALQTETPEDAVEWSTDEDLLWERDAVRHPNNFGTIIYGHTPSKTGVRWFRREEGDPYSVGVDVGCIFGNNPLSAVRTSDWSEFS
jgi:serine/threonine protein phosphatase 1